MRKTIALAGAAVAGAVVAALGVLTTRWWLLHHTAAGASTDFGWYAYGHGQPRAYVGYLPASSPGVDWWALLLPAALAGAVLGLLVALAVLLARQRRYAVADADQSAVTGD